MGASKGGIEDLLEGPSGALEGGTRGLTGRLGVGLEGPRARRVGKEGKGIEGQAAGRGRRAGAIGLQHRARQLPWLTYGTVCRQGDRRRKQGLPRMKSLSGLLQCSHPPPSHRSSRTRSRSG